MMPLEPNEQTFQLSYNFTSDEIAKLAKYLRDHQEDLPVGLEDFYRALENAVYSSLSLEEVKKFYS